MMDQDEKKDGLVVQETEIDETKKIDDENENGEKTMTDDELVNSIENDAEENDKPQTKKTPDKKVEEFVNLTEKEANFIKWLRKKEGSWPTPKECGNFLKISTVKVYEFIDNLRKNSYDIRVETGRVMLSREPIPGEELKLDLIKRDSFAFIVGSDLWLGNRFSQPDLLATLGAIAKKEKVDTIFVAGNLLTEKSKKRANENFFPSEKWLIKYILDVIPKVKDPDSGKTIKWHILGGSSDLSYKTKKGFVILREICSKREDLVYRGDEEIKFVTTGKQFRGLILHPGKEEVLQTKSYPVEGVAQNVVDIIKQSGEPLPNVIFMGGWGVPIEIPKYESGVWVFGLPSLRALTSTMKKNKKRGIVPTLGVWLVRVQFNSDSSIKDVDYEFIHLSQYQKPNACFSEPKRNNHSEKNPEQLSETEQKVLKCLMNKERVGEISRQTGLNKDEVVPIIKSLSKRGFTIKHDEARKKYLIEFEIKRNFESLPLDELFFAGIKTGHVSDTHIGDKGQQISALRDLYDKFAQEGVKVVFHTGDVLQGKFHTHPDSEKGLFLRGADKQLEYLIKNYPRPPKDKNGQYLFKTVIIPGSHDDSYKRIAREVAFKFMSEIMEKSGTRDEEIEKLCEQIAEYDVLKKFAEARDDVVYLGKPVANYVLPVEKDGKIIGQIKFRLHHPKGHSGKFLSNPPQTQLEIYLKRIAITNEEPVDVYSVGNYHKAMFMYYRGTFMFSVPALATGGEFMDWVSYSWIGGIINTWTLSKDGRITRVKVKFIPYTPKERDY